MISREQLAAVVIGRNEGARLLAGLAALQGRVGRIVYVDSGSTDGSREAAAARGADVVELDMSEPFTAARARNAGLDLLDPAETPFVQLIDGDCVVQPGWLASALAFLEAHPKTAIVCGRRREISPEASVFNRLCDIEWNTPVGSAKACGGDALCRLDALRDIGGFNPALIAGEEPEMCLRLRRAGWGVERLDAEMTLHDAAMTRFSQWWKRTRRAGHAFAEGAYLHGTGPESHWVPETRRALLWGAILPLLLVILVLFHPWFLAGFLIYPVQVARLAAASPLKAPMNWHWAFFMTLGKFAEAQGAVGFHADRLRNRRRGLIEYK